MTFLRISVAIALAAALAGCADIPNNGPFRAYAERLDSVSPTAGNALAANEAIQTINPAPRSAYNVYIPGDGARATLAVNCYEGKCDKTALPPPPTATQTLTAQ